MWDVNASMHTSYKQFHVRLGIQVDSRHEHNKSGQHRFEYVFIDGRLMEPIVHSFQKQTLQHETDIDRQSV